MNQEFNSYSNKLLAFGMTLFLLGLLTGLAIPSFTNSRMGLSAHLAGVQNGMFLLLLGLVWQRISLSDLWQRITYYLGIFSMYSIWATLVLAAAWGTSKATPIAGDGFESSASRETTVQLMVTVGAVATLAATVLALVGIVRAKRPI